MNQCEALKRNGKRCPILTDRTHGGRAVCHVHDPNGLYRRQHPKKTPLQFFDGTFETQERLFRKLSTEPVVRKRRKAFRWDPSAPSTIDHTKIDPTEEAPF